MQKLVECLGCHIKLLCYLGGGECVVSVEYVLGIFHQWGLIQHDFIRAVFQFQQPPVFVMVGVTLYFQSFNLLGGCCQRFPFLFQFGKDTYCIVRVCQDTVYRLRGGGDAVLEQFLDTVVAPNSKCRTQPTGKFQCHIFVKPCALLE